MNKNCETCMYYDYDEYYQEYICIIDLDEDESVDFMTNNSNECPYYRYYDE